MSANKKADINTFFYFSAKFYVSSLILVHFWVDMFMWGGVILTPPLSPHWFMR